MKLSKSQKVALNYLSKFPGKWVNTTPVTQKCLNVLSEKGLVKIAYDQELGWCEQITNDGISAIKE